MAGKQTKGRQKITMKRIENEEDRLITFSKRRSGIYKKASELVTLCGAEVSVVVFSPAGKPFTFGHPSVESPAIRYLGQDQRVDDCTHPLVEAHRKMRINELNHLHNQMLGRLEIEKHRETVLKQMTSGQESKGWWEAPIEELNTHQLQQMHVMMKELHQTLCCKIEEIRTNQASSSSRIPMHGATPFASNTNETAASSAAEYGYGRRHFQMINN